MKKSIFTLFTLFTTVAVSAQWNFDAKNVERANGSYKSLGKKATVVATNFTGGALEQDNDNSSIQNIGFDFKFNGQTFNTFVINTNGFIKLGSSAPSSKAIYYYTALGGGNCAITAKDSNLLYPFNRNLSLENEGSIKVLTSGAVGSRVCVIEFNNLKDKIGQYASVSFQIKLYEGSNVIEFVYGDWIASETAATLTVAAVGIKGNGAENSVNIAKGSGIDWMEEMNNPQKPYTFINGDYSTKGPNFGNKNTSLPPSGIIYRFNPLK